MSNYEPQKPKGMNYTICEKRRSIIEASGHCLILGGPGSGKTTLALMKASHRIEHNIRPGQSILFLSFSRAAVARIADAAKRSMLKNLDLICLQTFHSFFWSILQGHAYLLNAARPLRIIPAHEEAALRDGIKPDDPAWPNWERKRLELFHKEGRLCFDLFAPMAESLLTASSRLRRRLSSRHPLILVDEAQDTSQSQWECIRLLSRDAQIVCFADPDQMIYSNLPGAGVSADRVPTIRSVLKPHEIDLGIENNRSPGTEIATFARDIYMGIARGRPYRGVSVFNFQRTAAKRDTAIRQALGLLHKRIASQTGSAPESIAILVAYSRAIPTVSLALQKERPISHQVFLDEAFALLSAQVAAFLLEPRKEGRLVPRGSWEDVALLLQLAGSAFRANGTVSGRDFWSRCENYAQKIRHFNMPKVAIVKAAQDILEKVRATSFSGDANKDWAIVQRLLTDSGSSEFVDIAEQLGYIVAFSRSRRIAEALSARWLETGSYLDARRALDSALAQDQLFGSGDKIDGIHVMNSHKAKGKQFDGVILYRQEHQSPFLWRNESPPYKESRRLLHMAITRARKHVLILNEVFPRCPILGPHRLASE